MTNLYILFAVAAGAGVAAQAVINGRLRFILGAPVWAATAQFVVGLIVLVLFATLSRTAIPGGVDVARAPWWMWTGGIFGATFILMAVIATPALGAALMLASSIVGQLGAALVIDHYGLFGATAIPITSTRILGLVFLALGVILIRWT
ncbi:MAG TPA: DMT family transporter [Vicinamibacterales bacterium]|nr:DMT family transporter [Vicinamibacterales bacterium]